MKLQKPTSNLQRNIKLQYPKCSALFFFETAWILEFGVFAVKKPRMLKLGASLDVGAWNLEFPRMVALGRRKEIKKK
jgi:hypothetical protein